MLTVVVPATDNPPTLSRCLDALAAADDGPDELIVVRDSWRPGFAAARQTGARAAGGDTIVFVDSDVLVHRDAFTRIRAAFVADAELAAVFGSYDDIPEAPGIVSCFRNLLHHHVHQSSPGEIASFWCGLGAVRRAAFNAVGGFDPSERWLDDVDLGLRLADAGFRVELRPDVQGTHLKRWTLGSMIWTDFALRGVPWVQLALRRQNLPSNLNLGWRQRASTVVTVVTAGAIIKRKPLGAVLGLGALIALNWPFYTFLLRRQGPARALAGVGLHALHYLTSAVAVPGGVTIFALRQSTSRLLHSSASLPRSSV